MYLYKTIANTIQFVIHIYMHIIIMLYAMNDSIRQQNDLKCTQLKKKSYFSNNLNQQYLTSDNFHTPKS